MIATSLSCPIWINLSFKSLMLQNAVYQRPQPQGCGQVGTRPQSLQSSRKVHACAGAHTPPCSVSGFSCPAHPVATIFVTETARGKGVGGCACAQECTGNPGATGA